MWPAGLLSFGGGAVFCCPSFRGRSFSPSLVCGFISALRVHCFLFRTSLFSLSLVLVICSQRACVCVCVCTRLIRLLLCGFPKSHFEPEGRKKDHPCCYWVAIVISLSLSLVFSCRAEIRRLISGSFFLYRRLLAVFGAGEVRAFSFGWQSTTGPWEFFTSVLVFWGAGGGVFLWYFSMRVFSDGALLLNLYVPLDWLLEFLCMRVY